MKNKKKRSGSKRRRRFTPEFKREAVRLANEKEGELSLAQVAAQLGIGSSTLSDWRQRLEGRTPVVGVDEVGKAVEPLSRQALEQENRALRKRVARLQEEREILKKATAFFAQENE